MREWLARVIDWSRRDRLERELSDELRFHRERLERDAIARGASHDEARYAANRQLGGDTRVSEATRDYWSLPSLDAFVQDVRYATRSLLRTPIFTLTVIGTLGLGIGANAAMFGVVDRLLFRPIAYLREPSTAHRVYLQWTQADGRPISSPGISYRRYLDLMRLTSSFSAAAGASHRDIAVGQGEATREREVFGVTASYFDFFKASPVLGRFFGPGEDVLPLGADVAVLSHEYWTSELGARPDVLGQVLHVGDVRLTIIGVARRGFGSIEETSKPAMFVPFPTFNRATGYGPQVLSDFAVVLMRREPTVPVEAATTDLERAHRLSWADERANPAPGARPGMPTSQLTMERANPRATLASPRRAAGPEPALETRVAFWLTGVALVVLLIACANVANLFVARALQRQRETAVRIALGVSRRRILSYALTESLLVTCAGAIVGLLVAQWGGTALRSVLFTTMYGAPIDHGVMATFTDVRTLAAAVALAVAIAVVIGLAAASLVGRGDVSHVLRSGARGGAQRTRLRATLLVVQAAFSVALLVGAALFVRSLDKARAVPMGYDASRVLIVTPVFRNATTDTAVRTAVRQTMFATARAIPGVDAATISMSAPLWGTARMAPIVEGIDSLPRSRFAYNVVTPDYFRVMDIAILRGRGFTSADRAESPYVAVISASMAAELWPRQEAIGKCFRVVADRTNCRTIVGIAENIVQNNFVMTPVQSHFYYFPRGQFASSGEIVVVRTRDDPARSTELIRRDMQRVMPGASYVTVLPQQQLVDVVHRPWRIGAMAFVSLGVLAFIVAAVGLNGVVGYSVAQRTHELGVRVALGAQRFDVVRLVVAQSLRLAVAGVAIGVGMAYAGSRWIEPLLYKQTAKDPLVYAAVAVAMLLVALVASASPAARAVRADPNVALRAD